MYVHLLYNLAKLSMGKPGRHHSSVKKLSDWPSGFTDREELRKEGTILGGTKKRKIHKLLLL